MPAATRRPRVPRPVGLLAVGVVLALAYLGFSATSQTNEDAVLATLPAVEELAGGASARGPLLERADRSARDGQPREPGAGAVDTDARADAETFAVVADLELGLPHDEVVLVAFHEAMMREALALTPVGRMQANDNPTKFSGGQESSDGIGYHVLSSRGRPRPATSAVDIVLPPEATVVAPVTGTVVEARDYALYGSTRDWRVVIEPADRPDLHVVLIHLHRPAVEVGDEISAGRTPIAAARQLTFTSQVDYVTEQRLPHVHLEVKAATAPAPVDPNAPAVDLDEATDADLSD